MPTLSELQRAAEQSAREAEQLRHAHGAFEGEQFVFARRAVAPEAIARIGAHKGGDLRLIEDPRLAGLILDIPMDVLRQTDDAVHRDVRQRHGEAQNRDERSY